MQVTDVVERQVLPRLLTVKQTLATLGIGRTLLYELFEVGSLKSVKIGRRRLIPLSEIEGFIARVRG
jgi:excisionase family DNA binding protein